MAESKKYKIGDMEFDTEQEYKNAASDLKKIKDITAKYDINDPEQARKIMASVRSHPETFQSPYGKKFVGRLEKVIRISSPKTDRQAAGAGAGDVNAGVGTKAGSAGAGNRNAGKAGSRNEKAGKKTKEPRRAKEPKKPKEPGKLKKTGESGKRGEAGADGKLKVFTVRNFIIGIIVIVGIVGFSLIAPRIFDLNSGSADSDDIKRNMVTAYAKGQAELKAQLYTYYFNVVGETEEEAQEDAEKGISDNYVLDLSERTISRLTNSEIKEIYNQLSDGGDIQNNSFVEPAAITVLKDKLASAGLAGNVSNGMEGETAVMAAISDMMDYQYRVHEALCYDYGLIGFQPEDAEAYATEDMTALFGDVIYDFSMTEQDKQNYFESFTKKGLIKDNQVVRFSTDPTDYNLPDLTPTIEVAISGEEKKTYDCSMISYALGASVFYEIHSDDETGYICFRNNGENTDYIQLDADTSVTAQGDFLMSIGRKEKTLHAGQWFYYDQNIGLLMNGNHDSLISYVHELAY